MPLFGYVKQREALSLKLKFDAIYDVIMVSSNEQLKKSAIEYKGELNKITNPILQGTKKIKIDTEQT